MKRRLLPMSAILAFVANACIPGPGATPTIAPTLEPPTPMASEVPATPTSAPEAPTQTPTPAGLHIDQLRNTSYRFTDMPDTPVQLTDGVQPRDVNDPAGADYRVAGIVEGGEAIALGDLDGDGAGDAAVILTADPDGTGVFYHLFIMLSNAGEPSQAVEAFLGDRVALHEVSIANNEVTVRMDVAGPGDGACCPSQPSVWRYSLAMDLSLDVTLEENGVAVTYPVDYGGDPVGYAVAAQPARPWTPTGDEAPAEFGLSLPAFGQVVGVPAQTMFPARIRVYPVRSFAYYGFDAELASLEGVLAQPNPDLSAYANVISNGPTPTLPFLPPVNATQVFRAQPAVVAFGNGQGGSLGGRGVRYLTFYAQGLMPITRGDVWYTFQGLTEDGSSYVSVTFPVRIEDLAETPPADFNPPDYVAYLQEQFDIVHGAGNIQPALSLLDAIVGSIAVTRPPTAAQVITLETPTAGESVQNGVVVRGTANMWPFEATLVYQVHDSNGALIGEGPIMTTGDIPGPVTFEAPITFTATAAGIGWIDVLDLSANDGSVLGGAQVEVQLEP